MSDDPGVQQAAAAAETLRPSWRTPTLVVAAAFVVSRLAYAAAGVRFLYRHAAAYHHFVDPPVLRDHLVQSLWYDHVQPPGLNLVFGLALRVSPEHPDRFLWPLFLAVGLATALTLLHLLKRVGCSKKVAVAVTVAWSVSPTAVLLESYLMYTPLEILGLLLVALLVARWTEHGAAVDVVAAMGVASALALTRASFHLVWVAGLVVVLVLVRRTSWRVPLVAAVVPLVLVGGWYTKNLVLFDQFGPSSWLGANLSRVSADQLPVEERRALAADGTLSPYAPFLTFATFAEMGIEPPGATEPGSGVAVLSNYDRALAGFGNLHHRDYLVVNEARLDDALWTIRNRPGAYGTGISRAWAVTFALPSDFFGYSPNVAKIEPLVELERRTLGGWSPLPQPLDPELGRWGTGAISWFVLVGYAGVLAATAVRLVRGRAWSAPSQAQALVGVLWGTVVYLTVLTTLLEFGENNRFRSVTDPAVLVLVAWLVVEHRRRRSPGW